MKLQEIRARVFKINSDLVKMGYSIDEVQQFWKEVFEEVKNKV